jgi:hypothetical protein
MWHFRRCWASLQEEMTLYGPKLIKRKLKRISSVARLAGGGAAAAATLLIKKNLSGFAHLIASTHSANKNTNNKKVGGGCSLFDFSAGPAIHFKDRLILP